VSKQAKSEYITLRLTPKDKKAFFDKCEGMNRKPQHVLHELATAFNEGRVTIKPDEATEKQKELYND
jgi:hypothetical protein